VAPIPEVTLLLVQLFAKQVGAAPLPADTVAQAAPLFMAMVADQVAMEVLMLVAQVVIMEVAVPAAGPTVAEAEALVYLGLVLREQPELADMAVRPMAPTAAAVAAVSVAVPPVVVEEVVAQMEHLAATEMAVLMAVVVAVAVVSATAVAEVEAQQHGRIILVLVQDKQFRLLQAPAAPQSPA
jgi:hypothetical protein